MGACKTCRTSEWDRWVRRFGVLVFAVLTLLSGVERLAFIMRAERAMGRVTSVYAFNDRCSGGESSYDCTIFKAEVRFAAGGLKYRLIVSAGSVGGHGRTAYYASHRVGDAIPVIFDPQDPTWVYLDCFIEIWLWPWIGLLITGAFFIFLKSLPPANTFRELAVTLS